MNLQKFYTGQAFNAYEYFGAHQDRNGFVFRTYAPGAQRITLVGDFNGWKEQPMEQLYQSGVWTGYVQGASFGQMYKYCIYGSNGRQEQFLRIGHTSRLLILLNFSDRTVSLRTDHLKEFAKCKPALLLNTRNAEEDAAISKAPGCLPESIDPYTGMLFRLQ